jgi:hypothetical protein
MIGLLSFYPLKGKTPGGTVGVTSPSAPGTGRHIDGRARLAGRTIPTARLRAVATGCWAPPARPTTSSSRRGRRHIRGADTTPTTDAAAAQDVVEAFLAAARDGNFDALVAVFDPDIVVREDTGSGTLVEVRGAEQVARRATAVSRLGLVARPELANGAAGWVSLLDGQVYAIVALTLRSGRIATMDILLDPARLARVDLGGFHARS